MAEIKCAFCDGIIAYEPYYETIGGKKLAFHAKPCADTLKASKYTKCTFCGGLIAYEPYVETIEGKKLPFHAKACADAYKKKK
jgi:predicted transcriptional regulator